MTPRNVDPKGDTERIEKLTQKWDVCDVRYVRWQAATVWLIGMIGVVVSVSFAGGRWGANMEAQLNTLERRCDRIEQITASIDTVNHNVKLLLQEIQK